MLHSRILNPDGTVRSIEGGWLFQHVCFMHEVAQRETAIALNAEAAEDRNAKADWHDTDLYNKGKQVVQNNWVCDTIGSIEGFTIDAGSTLELWQQ